MKVKGVVVVEGDSHSGKATLKKPSPIRVKYVTKKRIISIVCEENNKKYCQDSDVLVKIITEKANIVSYICQNNFNNSIFSFIFFLSDLKTENLALVCFFFKQDQSNIENSRPISFFPDLSKIYERCKYDRMYK